MAVSQTLTLTQSSQSESGNYSKVRIVWKTTQTGESYNGYERTAYYYVSINGGAETRYSVKYTLPKGSTKTLVDKTITVNHKADGKGSVKVRTWMDTDISAGTIEKSQSLTLDTIPRATTPSLSATSVNMGSNVTIDLPRASSGFTHDLAYKVSGESTWNTFKTGATTTYTWATPDLATKVPKATSLGITLRVITKSGSTTVGTKTVAMTLKVPTSVKPTVSSLTAVEATSGLAAQFGAFIQNKSKLAVSLSAAGAKGSTITERKVTVTGLSETFTSASFTTDVLPKSGTVAITAQVKDSRGRWSDAKTLNVNVLAYTKPKIQAMKAYRCTAAGTPADDGAYIAVQYQYSVASLGNKNTAAMELSSKKSIDSSYTRLTTGTALSANTTYVSTVVHSIDNSYDVALSVEDWFGESTTAYTEAPSAAVIFDILANGKGFAVGKTAEEEGFDIGWPIVGALQSIDTAMQGYYRTHDGLLLQWGSVSITPAGANVPTTAVINFPKPFAATPLVFCTPVTSVPETVNVGTLRSGDGITDTKLQHGIVLTRAGTTTTGISWLAIGKGA